MPNCATTRLGASVDVGRKNSLPRSADRVARGSRLTTAVTTAQKTDHRWMPRLTPHTAAVPQMPWYAGALLTAAEALPDW